MPNRNVRITYPDSPDGTLEVDVIQGVEISLNLTFADLKYYAKDGVLKIRQNLWANPDYRNFLFSKTAHVSLNNENPARDNENPTRDNENPTRDNENPTRDNDDSHLVDLTGYLAN